MLHLNFKTTIYLTLLFGGGGEWLFAHFALTLNLTAAAVEAVM